MAFYDEFKKIRTQISKYPKPAIFNICMDALSQVWNLHLIDIYNKNLPNPMHTLLMLKWGLIYGEHPRMARKTFEAFEFSQLHNEIQKLLILEKLLKDDDSLAIPKYTRAIMSHQQYYNKKSGLYGLVLTETILNRIGIKYDCDTTLMNLCGLTIEEFTFLQFILATSISAQCKYRSYSINYYKNLFEVFGREKVTNFFNYISCDINELETFVVADHKKIKYPEYESAILSSLYKKPLYRVDQTFFPYHTALIEANIEYGIYDILKGADSKRFCSPFGRGFEEYISLTLRNNDIKFKREDEIRKYTHRDSVCDFMAEDTGSTVFLEAKSAEMYYLTRQNPQEEYLEQTLENSLISGYKQIITLIDFLKNRKDPTVEGKDLYGIIVTFKDLLLGFPDNIWAEFMENFMSSRLEKRIIENLPISPSKIFVISAYELDHMLAYARKYRKTLPECLQIAHERNSDRKKRTFFFHDNFEDDSIKVIESGILKDEFRKINGRIEDALLKGEMNHKD